MTLACRARLRYRGSVLMLAGWSSLLHLSLRGSQVFVDTASERAEAELSNAVSTRAWKPQSGEWLAFTSELESAGISTGPL